jgi:acyl transferase domain-containing protein
MAPRRDTPPAIAVVGMGLRLPGGISTTQDFWDLLVNKGDGKCRVPLDRYNVDAFHGDGSHRQAVASDHGYFLKDVLNLKAFDASFFSMNRTEVEILDPQQRLLLEVVWECMENAGQTSWRGTDIGCYVGVFGEDWHDLMTMDTQASGLFRISGNGDFAISNRISYEYDLKGPR